MKRSGTIVEIRSQVKPIWTLAIVASVALLLTLSYLAPYATLNQATYLLDPLHRAMPELFGRDWFVNQPPYLPGFGWLVQWLYVIDPDGPTAFLIVHVIVTLATYAAIYWLVAALEGGWRAFAIVASFITFTKDVSMGGSYLLVGYLQPSSLATLGWVVGMAALARDRYLVCGIAVALAGALHANFLVLGVGLFGFAAFARRDASLRDYANLLGPQVIVLACFLPSLLGAAKPNDEAIWVLTHFHSPLHYGPERLTGWITDVLAWQLGAYAAMYLLAGVKPAHVLWRFSLVASAIVTLSALLVRYTRLESLTELFCSRIAPFDQLACQVIIASAVVRQAFAPRPLSIRVRVLVSLAILAPLYKTGRHLHLLISWQAIGIAAAVLLVTLAPWPRVARVATSALAGLALAYALWNGPRGAGFTTTPYATPAELALVEWARTQTPVDALFLAPPDLHRFRLLARRAVIADTKSPPLRPDLLVQWHQRLCAMVLLPGAQTSVEVEARYARLTPAELEQVARSFGADYILVKGEAQFAYLPVFRNDEFAVYRVPWE